ncbi:MAG: glutathione S-transferase family protein [Devosia sp.]
MKYTIILGNKNYSSWSMRAWLVLDHFGFDYEEELIPLDEPDTRGKILAYSPAGKVPCLAHGAFVVWDSLAIIEYLAETKPEANIWPEDRLTRARARAVSAEMHSGFSALRRACPMNLRKTFRRKPRGGVQAKKDVARIEEMIREQLNRSGGPFLFGEYSAADAMYAPITARLTGYDWPMEEATSLYVQAVQSEASYVRWREAALKEPWVIAADETK